MAKVLHRPGMAMLTLLLITLLSACEQSQTVVTPAEVPIIPQQVPLNEPVAEPTAPEAGRQDEEALPAAESRKPDSLELNISDRPLAVQSPPVFGADPNSGWLDSGQGDVGADTRDDGLLPDLFADQQREKPVSVKGKMLVDDGSEDISDAVDGAKMSIEIQTD